MDEQIIARLCQLRKQHGYSQEQLADELGVSRQAVSKWERGEASPDTDNLIALAKLYNISVDDLLFEKPTEQPAEQPAEKAENNVQHRYHGTAAGVVAGVTVMACCIAYVLMGCLGYLWHPGWIVFFAIPVLPTIPAAIKEKDPHIFCFPVLIAGIYLLFGFVPGWWHPGWVIFLTIPIYYIIADFVKKK